MAFRLRFLGVAATDEQAILDIATGIGSIVEDPAIPTDSRAGDDEDDVGGVARAFRAVRRTASAQSLLTREMKCHGLSSTRLIRHRFRTLVLANDGSTFQDDIVGGGVSVERDRAKKLLVLIRAQGAAQRNAGWRRIKNYQGAVPSLAPA